MARTVALLLSAAALIAGLATAGSVVHGEAQTLRVTAGDGYGWVNPQVVTTPPPGL